MLKRREIENYLYDKEVLVAYCAAEGLTFDVAEYDTLVRNILDDDVKLLTSAIKKLCGIFTSVDQDIFKLNLAKIIAPNMMLYKELEGCIFERQ